MTGSGTAPVSISLRDGTQLSVTPAGILLGARFFELARIQDARQVSPDPEAFALRVAGTGLVEFQPARPGDGNVALEALFRFRPDLRPAGFVGPSGSPAYAPPPSYPPPFPPPPATNIPAGGYPPPPGYGAPPPSPPGSFPRAAYYGPSPNAQQGELTPYPRTFGELLSAIFQLYGKHIRKWLALGFWVVLLPGIFIALAQSGVELLLGVNPFSTGPLPQQIPLGANCLPILPASLTHDLLIEGPVFAGSVLLSLVAGAWQTASFANAGREAVLGRPIPLGASLRRGGGRLFPTLGATIAVILAGLAALAPGIVCVVIAFAGLAATSSSNLCASQGAATVTASSASISGTGEVYALLSCFGFLLLIAGFIVALFLWIRLIVAPVVAATERVSIGTALSQSWRLTYRGWWRCFGVILIVSLVVGLVTLTVSEVTAVPVAAVFILASPLAQWIISPLQELASIVLLFDLRLRREGYAALTQASPTAVPLAAVPHGPPYEPPPAQG